MNNKFSEDVNNIIGKLYVRYYHNGIRTNYLVNCDNDGVRVYSEVSNRFLNPSFDNEGYKRYGLTINGKLYKVLEHRMVASIYVPNNDSNNKTIVDHLSENKQCNHPLNLEWVTGEENTRRYFMNHINDAKFRGRKKKGRCRNPKQTSFSEDTIRKIFERLQNGETVSDIANSTDMRYGYVRDLAMGKYHRDIFSEYNIPETCITKKERRPRLDDSVVDKIRDMRESGLMAKEIAKQLDLPLQSVYNAFYYKI